MQDFLKVLKILMCIEHLQEVKFLTYFYQWRDCCGTASNTSMN